MPFSVSSTFNNGSSNNGLFKKMTTFRHKSFLFGVTLASITWAASFYLYLTLTSSSPDRIPLSISASTSVDNNINDEDLPPSDKLLLSQSSSSLLSFDRPQNYFPKNTVFLNNELYDKEDHDAKDDENVNQIKELSVQGKWRKKFQQLINDKSTKYKNSEKLINSLNSKVKIDAGNGKLEDIGKLGLIQTLVDKKIREEGYRKR